MVERDGFEEVEGEATSETGDRTGVGEADEIRGTGEARDVRLEAAVVLGRRIEGARCEEEAGRGGVGIDDKGGFGIEDVTESKKASKESSSVSVFEGCDVADKAGKEIFEVGRFKLDDDEACGGFRGGDGSESGSKGSKGLLLLDLVVCGLTGAVEKAPNNPPKSSSGGAVGTLDLLLRLPFPFDLSPKNPPSASSISCSSC